MSSLQASHLKACEGRSTSSVRPPLGQVWGKTRRDEPGVARGLGGMTDTFFLAALAPLVATFVAPLALSHIARADAPATTISAAAAAPAPAAPAHPSDDDLAAAATAGEVIVVTGTLGRGAIAGVLSGELRDGPAVRRGDDNAAVATTIDASQDQLQIFKYYGTAGWFTLHWAAL